MWGFTHADAGAAEPADYVPTTESAEPTAYELLLRDARERAEARAQGAQRQNAPSEHDAGGARIARATALARPGMDAPMRRNRAAPKDPLRTLMKAMKLKAGPEAEIGETPKRGKVPIVSCEEPRGVAVVPNPCKTSHCSPGVDDHGLALSLPHRTGYVGGVSSGKSAALIATLAHCHAFRRYAKIFLMSPNNELIRDSEYGVVDECECLEEWPELTFWNDQPARVALICDDVSWALSKRGKPSQMELAERTCGAMSSHHPGGIDIYIAQQTMTGIVPAVRRLLSHWALFPKRIAQDTHPQIARTLMLDKGTLQRAFDACDSGPHSFLLVSNVQDGRPRLRVDGWREVAAFL